MVLIIMEWLDLEDVLPGSLFGRMVFNQGWWNNTIMAAFATILGHVVFGADYFRVTVDQKEIEFVNRAKGEGE